MHKQGKKTEDGRKERQNQLRAVEFALLVCALCAAICAGCGSKEEIGSGMQLYYLNEDLSSLQGRSYVASDGKNTAEMDGLELAEDMLEQLSEQTDQVDEVAPIQNFRIEKIQLTDGAMTVTLSEEYENLSGTREILTRAAIVNTLCQLEEVDSVSFLCGDHSLYDSSGNPIGAETADMFIYSSGKEIDNYEKAQLHLYFADESGTMLVDTWRTVVYNSNVALERVVVEQVLKGPNSDVVFPTVNENTKILSVTTRDGICYVNLDQNFLTDPYSVTAQVAVYSLVNSLTELPSVQAVQITIDGDQNRNLMELSLANQFERNKEILCEDSE
jgi:germination protein M